MGTVPILKNAKKKFRAVLRPKMLNFQIWLLYYLNAQGKSLSYSNKTKTTRTEEEEVICL